MGVRHKLEANRDEVILLYQSGLGCTRLARHFGVHESSITYFLKRHKVATRGPRRYDVDEEFFNQLDTEAKAYTIGLWLADGCNMPQHPAIILQLVDLELVEQIKLLLRYEGPIYEALPRGFGKLPSFTLRISSRKLSDALVGHGCGRRKSKHINFPVSLDSSLYRHFIRGYMDGDGTISCGSRGQWYSRIIGCCQMCQQLSLVVKMQLGFGGSFCCVCKSKQLYGFGVYGHRQLKSYLDWLYDGATVYLRRKFAKYQEFLRCIS